MVCASQRGPVSPRHSLAPSDAGLLSGVPPAARDLEPSPVSVYNRRGSLFATCSCYGTCRQLRRDRRKALKTILIAVQRSPMKVTLMPPFKVDIPVSRVAPATGGPRVSLDSLLLAISTAFGEGSPSLPRFPSLARRTWAAWHCCSRPRRPPVLLKTRAAPSVCTSSHARG